MAWAQLLARYDDKKLLAQKHMTSVASMRNLKDESSTGLQGLLDDITRSREALRAFDQTVNNWDAWFILFAAKGMDQTTRREWQKWVKSKESPYTYDHLKEFLQEAIRSLKTLETSRGSGQESQTSRSRPSRDVGQSSRVFAIASDDTSCRVCHEAHQVSRCNEFRRASIEQRRTLANRLKLCYNCL